MPEFSMLNADFRTLVCACEDILSYLKLSGMIIGGATYGSDKLVIDPNNKQRLWILINKRFRVRAGCDMSFTPDDVALVYSGNRKGNYKALRDDKPITHNNGPTLFDEIAAEPEPVATLYAFIGLTAKTVARLIKIGYTTQKLSTYLRGKDIPHNPILLATRCGGRPEEKEELSRYRHQLAVGREWFYPSEQMFADFTAHWNIEPGFDRIVAALLLQHKGGL